MEIIIIEESSDEEHSDVKQHRRTPSMLGSGGGGGHRSPNTTGIPSEPSSSTPITPQQRQRMESNRRLALAKQQQRRLLRPTTPILSEQQESILAAVANGRSVFITGSGGTGKSFLLKHVITLLRKTHPPTTVFVTASTGVAACAINGQTLHSFAGVGLGVGDPNALFRKAVVNKATAKRWRSASALVVDEISMIDGELFDSLDHIARMMRESSAPWGGIQLVVSGDFFQLPPINSPNPRKEFAFQADCWDSSFDIQVELTHVFRQSDSQLIQLLQGIRRGRTDNLDHLLNRCTSTTTTTTTTTTTNDSKMTILFPRNEDVRRVNNERLRSIGGEVVSYRAVDTGGEHWKGQLKQGIAPEELGVCLGARVMLTKNTDPGQGLVNGASGVVIGFVERKDGAVTNICVREMLPMVRFDSGVELVVEPERWDVMEGEAVMATRRQIPLILAWALSVHRCQGMTLDRLHTDLSRAFGCGMVYVALSRVRSLDGLSLSGFDPGKIKAHPKVVEFYNRLFVDTQALPSSP